MGEITRYTPQEVEKKLKKKLKKLQKKGLDRTFIGTTSERKYQGMSSQYSRKQLKIAGLDLDHYGYREPNAGVEATIESKAIAALIILGLVNSRDFEQPSLQFSPEHLDELQPLSKGKYALIDVMDATTDVSGEPILKLSRDYPNFEQLPFHEANEILELDKKRMKERYQQPFEVIFEGGRGIISTQGRFANSIAIRYIVKFRPLPDDVIDEAYKNPKVWNIGPRVDLASLVSTRKELIEEVMAVDINNPNENRILNPIEYHKVTDLIVYGKVDDENMLELLRKGKNKERLSWQRFRRIRANL